jgi:DnaJ like chaperone protein
MALKHHPDRLIHLGKEYQKSAKEKFQIISDAYEYIKDRKGFS